MPIFNLLESIVDAFRDSVLPRLGSVLYCDLAFGFADHSGIYVGNNEVAHLSGDGRIELTSPEKFMFPGTALHIYVSCIGEFSVGSAVAAQRARGMVGSNRQYNAVFDNCHQFCAGCLTGQFDNASNFLMFLKEDTRKELGSDTWRIWTTRDGNIVNPDSG